MSGPRPPFPGAIGATHLRVYDTTRPTGWLAAPRTSTPCAPRRTSCWPVPAWCRPSPPGLRRDVLEPGAWCGSPRAPSTGWSTAATSRSSCSCRTPACPRPATWSSPWRPTWWPMPMPTPGRHVARRRATTTGTGAGARIRRDRAVETFVGLRAAVEAGRVDELVAFHAAAAALVAPQLDRWRAVLADGPAAEVVRTQRSLAALAAGDHTHLADASVHRIGGHDADAVRRMGCCGTLGTYLPEPRSRGAMADCFRRRDQRRTRRRAIAEGVLRSAHGRDRHRPRPERRSTNCSHGSTRVTR